jgi:acyl-CoA reductase-like NAD-dependent aldehyde dehydrogenase
LMDAALASEGAERVALLGSVADSAKRFGAMVERSQIDKLREVAETGDEAEATAAAAVIGALGLTGDLVTPLILGGR